MLAGENVCPNIVGTVALAVEGTVFFFLQEPDFLPNMPTVAKFFKDAGYYGGGSVLLAVILFGVTLLEHARGHSVPVFWLLILVVIFFCVGSLVAWRKEYDKVAAKEAELQKYLDESPRLGLHIVSFFGRKEWRDQADSRNTPTHFAIEHLGGRIPTDVRFDPLQSKKHKWTLCFGSLPYVKPPVRQGLEYEVLDEETRIDSSIIDHLGWGTFLLGFVNDADPQSDQDEYLLTVRYMDGDAESTQTFKLIFDKIRFGFLSNTMHL